MKTNELAIEPWGIDLSKKIKIFDNAKKSGKKIALYYAKAPDSSTFRYRCFNTMQATAKSKKWQAIFFCKNEIKTLEKLIFNSDLFIFGRQARWDSTIEKITKLAKEAKIPILFDLDDLVFDKKYIRVVTNTIGELSNLDYWMTYFSDINMTAKHCDGFVVTNDYLGERIAKSFGKPYQVIRNSLNDEQLAASKAYLAITEIKKQNEFIIGYFSGSPTHINDLDVALPEILEFLRLHPKAKLRVVGLMKFDQRATEFLKNKQIEFVPPVDFRKLQKLMLEVDVNIAPLIVNDFTNCKSELKFFEAAAVETTTIASPSYTFKNAITDGKNGFLAEPGEWYDKLEYLYKHPEENKKIAKKAKEYALKHYYGEEFLKEVEATYDYFAK